MSWASLCSLHELLLQRSAPVRDCVLCCLSEYVVSYLHRQPSISRGFLFWRVPKNSRRQFFRASEHGGSQRFSVAYALVLLSPEEKKSLERSFLSCRVGLVRASAFPPPFLRVLAVHSRSEKEVSVGKR